MPYIYSANERDGIRYPAPRTAVSDTVSQHRWIPARARAYASVWCISIARRSEARSKVRGGADGAGVDVGTTPPLSRHRGCVVLGLGRLL
jgi:hypothetical protein